MEKKSVALLLLIVTIGVIIAGVAYAQSTANPQEIETAGIPAPMIANIKYIYAAKYVCGDGTDSQAVVPSKYMTAINVHNPQTANVSLTKKVARAPREDDKPIPPSKKLSYLIQPDYAFDIDCADITKIGGIPTGTFSTGFVVIESPKQLDVVGVYTSIGPNNDVTFDVETVSPKAVIPAIATVAADLPVD